MISTVAGVLNLVLGVAYIGIGALVTVDMRRGWRKSGFSPFGAALIAIAFTCGPHHLFHAVHVLFEGRVARPLDLLSILIGLPMGIIWLRLRVEAFTGGRGDRLISGTPLWLKAVPTAAGVYITVLITQGLRAGSGRLHLNSVMVPNFALVAIYATIGYVLLRTQLRNHSAFGGWSASGLSLGAIFSTCAAMHAVTLIYGAVGTYGYDVHAFYIDWLSVPAGLYFLAVVRSLYINSQKDWNKPDPARIPVLAK